MKANPPAGSIRSGRSDPSSARLGPLLHRYFFDYLINQRQLSPQTIAAYRDAFKLLLQFVTGTRGAPCDDLSIADIDAPQVLAFLADLEKRRGNTARSRNARLAAIRSFFRYATSFDPLLLPVAQRVLAIPSKRFDRPVVGHLTRPQMQAILQSTALSTAAGARDRILLLLMYNTGARVSEIAGLRMKDLQFGGAGTAMLHLHGKGRKQRTVPLWRETAKVLKAWLRERRDPAAEDPLLPNSAGEFMTRSGIASRLRAAVKAAAKRDASLLGRSISPHTIRHTTAMHLLQSGVDLSVIAIWLGHEHLQTTHQYLDADVYTKRLALAHLQSPTIRRRPRQRSESLMQFLEGL